MATIFYPPGFAFGASDEDLMGLRRPPVKIWQVWREQGTLSLIPCQRRREGAVPKVLMPPSGWPWGPEGKQQGSSPPKGQPQEMVVLAQRRKCWGEWVLEPPLPTPFSLRRQKKG